MSVHKSLKGKSSLVQHRNVLTRAERVEILKQEDRYEDGDPVCSLPKVRSIKMQRKSKAKKTEEEEGTEESTS